MELVCEKCQEKIDSEKAVCQRPKEYCKFRSACLLHFLVREKAGAEKKEPEDMGGEGK
ncbi:MAG: RNA polymerase II-associated protein [Deltaproteobacteria bacterium]|nr:RNA polymerase II-associated protein [Deltaproteobacteria bacterium]